MQGTPPVWDAGGFVVPVLVIFTTLPLSLLSRQTNIHVTDTVLTVAYGLLRSLSCLRNTQSRTRRPAQLMGL